MDEGTWTAFHAFLKKKHGTAYGHVAEELAAAINNYIVPSEGTVAQHHLMQDSILERPPRADVQRSLAIIRLSLAKQLISDPKVQWHRLLDKALTNMIEAALRKGERTRRNYVARMVKMGVVKGDLDEPDYVLVSAAWVFGRPSQLQETKDFAVER